ncbi:hypothetical protein [Streptomyces europaeiscabiei]
MLRRNGYATMLIPRESKSASSRRLSSNRDSYTTWSPTVAYQYSPE